jgi:protein phosphatase
MLSVPYHSLVLLSNRNLKNKFPIHEFVDIESIKGTLNHRDCNPDVLFEEIFYVLESKFRLGDRVVMVVNDQYQKELYAKFCEDNGAKIFVGDADYKPVLQPNPKNFSGITVIGDVHGDIDNLRSAIKWGIGRSNLLCFLGDIIDYGNDNIEVMNTVYSLVMQGKAIMMMGNHERKILKWLNNKKVKLSDGNMKTVNNLNKLSDEEKQKWIGRFKSLCAHTKVVYEIDDFVFTHGAVHQSYWLKENNKNLEHYAYYGESSDNNSLNYRLMYNWVNYIPKNKTVIVGHDTRSTVAPLIMNSSNGGSAIFLDTGSGKGGKLTSADLKFDNNKLKLSNYNKY